MHSCGKLDGNAARWKSLKIYLDRIRSDQVRLAVLHSPKLWDPSNRVFMLTARDESRPPSTTAV